MYIKLACEGLPKNLFQISFNNHVQHWSVKFNRREAQSLKALKYVVRLPHSVRGLGKSR